MLGEVVTATTVRVYERVKLLRMQPKKGQYGSQEFDTFVDKVFNPMLIAADSEVQHAAEHIGWIHPNHSPSIPIGFIYKSIHFN